MNWNEVRELYPNQFVKFEILESHREGNYEVVDEVAIIKPILNGKEAMQEFVKCKLGQLVYSTKHENISIEIVKHVGIRRSI